MNIKLKIKELSSHRTDGCLYPYDVESLIKEVCEEQRKQCYEDYVKAYSYDYVIDIEDSPLITEVK